MRLGGFEPPTPALGEPRSIHTELQAHTTTKSFIERSMRQSSLHLN